MTFLKNISLPGATDEELVAAYRNTGNKEILGALYQRYMDLVFAVCIKYLKNGEEAKDAVMNIFEELVGKLMKYEVTHFKSWLYTVAKTHCLMQLRSASKIKTVQVDPEIVQSAQELHLNGIFEKETALDQLSICMENLSIDQKQVVDLFYLQKKCYKEIAMITGDDWNKVRSLIQNARRNLKICMEKQGGQISKHE